MITAILPSSKPTEPFLRRLFNRLHSQKDFKYQIVAYIDGDYSFDTWEEGVWIKTLKKEYTEKHKIK